ncbi:autotransporter domain-containing protein [Ochrobactrum pseudogrignonense]|nr:autotransporter domain-containing protein [Brucella pseudogrignonensis]
MTICLRGICVAKGALVNQSHFINSAITSRLQQASGMTPTAPVATMNYVSAPKEPEAFEEMTPELDSKNLYTGWGYVYGAWSEQDLTSNTSRMKSSVGGFVTGIDRLVYENWRLGPWLAIVIPPSMSIAEHQPAAAITTPLVLTRAPNGRCLTATHWLSAPALLTLGIS